MKSISFLCALSALSVGSAQAATYQAVRLEQSQLTFRYQQMGVHMNGGFKKFNAAVNLNTQKLPQAQGSLEIDLASIDTGSTEADEEVRSKAWFNTQAHPKARFVLKSLKAITAKPAAASAATSASTKGAAAATPGTSMYEAQGQLTLKGQTRDLTIPVQLTPEGRLSGSWVLRRADFNIGEGMWAKFDVVANEITVFFDLQLK